MHHRPYGSLWLCDWRVDNIELDGGISRASVNLRGRSDIRVVPGCKAAYRLTKGELVAPCMFVGRTDGQLVGDNWQEA